MITLEKNTLLFDLQTSTLEAIWKRYQVTIYSIKCFLITINHIQELIFFFLRRSQAYIANVPYNLTCKESKPGFAKRRHNVSINVFRLIIDINLTESNVQRIKTVNKTTAPFCFYKTMTLELALLAC